MEYWKGKALDKLKDFPRQAANIDRLGEELQRLELEATSVKTARIDAGQRKQRQRPRGSAAV